MWSKLEPWPASIWLQALSSGRESRISGGREGGEVVVICGAVRCNESEELSGSASRATATQSCVPGSGSIFIPHQSLRNIHGR